MVRARDEKTTKNGEPFAILQLGNATGQIAANIWKEELPGITAVKPGSIVQVIGTIETYQNKRQLKLTAPPRIVASSATNLDEFLPSASVTPPALWEQIDKWRGAIRSPKLRTVVDLFFADDAFRAAFERTPGAPRGHHAVLGGLLLHVVEVATIARGAVKTMHGDVDLVTAGALLHDIGKVETYAITAAGFEFTQAGHLLQHVVLGSLMLDRRLRNLPTGTLTETQELELQHFIQSHHGIPEHGAAARPLTPEADLPHRADQSSAKGHKFTDHMTGAERCSGCAESHLRRFWRIQPRSVPRRA